MRHRRILARKDEAGYYHVICRTSSRRFLLDEKEKGNLLNFVRRSAEFSGVELLTYAVMSNHLHLLVKVDVPRPVSDAELLLRMLTLYGRPKYEKTLEEWEKWCTADGGDARIKAAKAALRKRMFSLSQFCKTFKELYAMGYNRRNKHETSVWGGARFKSVLLCADRRTLMAVASYIDLNPVRAKIVGVAAEYRWCGCGAAAAGDGMARAGLCSLVRLAYGAENATWKDVRCLYSRCMDDGIPASISELPGKAPPLTEKEIARAIRKYVGIPWRDYVRCRVRPFTDGLILGPDKFVRERMSHDVAGSYESGRKHKSVCKTALCPDLNLFMPVRIRNGREISVSKKSQTVK